ncbi:AAA family ATPase [Streptomyces sp. NPDC093228]|uniref:helix-turn-helix transcriptional regulator n=1 Tax=Streptomyces sp. NPDC093228 TaxID=3155070 RepID=UPI00343CE466
MSRLVLRGRSQPVAAALSVLRRTLRLSQSGFILVNGEAGIGKSALLSEVCHQGRVLGFRVGVGKCEEAEVVPAQALFSALRGGARPLLEGSGDVPLDTLVDRPLSLVDHISEGLEKLTVNSPVLVGIDDAQWADPVTMLALRALPARLSGYPIVWVITTRDPRPLATGLESAADSAVPVETVELGPLEREHLSAMAHDRLQGAPQAATLAMLDKVHGNPFLAVQVLDGVRRARARGEDEGDVPTEFIVAVRERIQRLSTPNDQLVRTVAVLGRPFRVDEAAALLDLPISEAGRSIDQVVAAGLLHHWSYTVAFRHDLVRETVYADLSDAERRRLHARCSDYLTNVVVDPVAAAPHVSASAVPGDEASAALLVNAAEQAAQAMPDMSAQLAVRAFRILRPSQAAWSVVGERAVRALLNVQRSGEAVAIADDILARSADPYQAATLQAHAARALWVSGRAHDAVPRVDRALGSPLLPDPLRAELYAVRALARTRLAPAHEVAVEAEAALAQARAAGSQAAVILALEACGEAARNSGHHQEALRWFQQLRAATGVSYLSQEVTALQMVDRYDDADTILAAAREDANNTVEAVLPSMLFAQLWQDFNRGRIDEAESIARTVLTLSREIGTSTYEFDAHCIIGSITINQGNVTKAREILGTWEDFEHEDEIKVTANALVQGQLAAAEGDPGKAVRILSPYLYSARESRSYWPWWPGWMLQFAGFGLAARDQDFVDEALRVARVGADRNPGIASFEGVSLLLEGIVTANVVLVGEASKCLEHSPRVALQAAAAEQHGRLLAAAGSKAEAVTELQRALDLVLGMGGTPDTRGLHSALSLLGVSTAVAAHQIPSAGWGALTEAEMRVARLISAGCTNKSAANELSVSINTIGTHMRSIFAKLGIRSRVQLANAFHERQT